MASIVSQSLAVGTLVSFAPAEGHSQVDLHADAPIMLVPGMGEPWSGRVLSHTSEAVTIAVDDSRLMLTPVAATLEEGPSLDYKGAWAVQSITPLG